MLVAIAGIRRKSLGIPQQIKQSLFGSCLGVIDSLASGNHAIGSFRMPVNVLLLSTLYRMKCSAAFRLANVATHAWPSTSPVTTSSPSQMCVTDNVSG
jgi:hypothetical protein